MDSTTAMEGLDAALSTPLASLNLPTRLANVLERRGVESLAELARLTPEELLVEKNLGRRSVVDARLAIQTVLGTTWEEARRRLLEREAKGIPLPVAAELLPSTDRRAARWETYRASLTQVFGHVALSELELPARLHTFASSRGIVTLGGLLSVSWDDFSKARNVGRSTLAVTLALLESMAARVLPEAPESKNALGNDLSGSSLDACPPIPDGARWLSLLRDALATLDGQERIIATQRSGLAGPIPTLQELGECFGVSRERIRQLEARAIERLQKRLARTEANRRLARACESLLTGHEVAARRDALFRTGDGEAPTLLFFVNDVLDGDVHALLLEDRLVFSRAEQGTLTALLKKTVTHLCGATFPVEEADLARSAATALDVSVAAARDLFDYLDVPILRDGSRMLGLGRTRDDEVLATVRAADGPVERSRIEERHGRGRLPEGLVFVDSGLVSLPEKIEGWERWARRLPPIARRLMEREGPNRQWPTEELAELLSTECELPEWMNAWTLGSILRRSSEVEYLGRNVVALPSATSGNDVDQVEAKRVHIAPAIEEILRAHGRPMPEDDARAALGKIRGVSSHAWNMFRTHRPFLVLDGDMLGLYPRDVPGGEARASYVLDALHEWLAAEQSGLSGAEVLRFLTEVGEGPSGITPRALRSIARLDGRFRLSVSGAIGLAEWESVRVPTQAETLEALLAESAGRAAIDVVRARIMTSSGDPLPRSQLANLAGSIGARIDGNCVVRREPPDASKRSALVSDVLTLLPERTATVFERLFDEVLGTPEEGPTVMAEKLSAWADTLRAHASTDAPHIELEQVAMIESGTRALLAKLGELVGEARSLALAAVRYVICTDDADTDLSVGGLDDDEAVLARVSGMLGVL